MYNSYHRLVAYVDEQQMRKKEGLNDQINEAYTPITWIKSKSKPGKKLKLRYYLLLFGFFALSPSIHTPILYLLRNLLFSSSPPFFYSWILCPGFVLFSYSYFLFIYTLS